GKSAEGVGGRVERGGESLTCESELRTGSHAEASSGRWRLFYLNVPVGLLALALSLRFDPAVAPPIPWLNQLFNPPRFSADRPLQLRQDASQVASQHLLRRQ